MPRKPNKKRKADVSGICRRIETKGTRVSPTSAQGEPSSHSARPIGDDVPFFLECPARRSRKAKKRKQSGQDDWPKEEDGGFPNLSLTYTIRPGKRWTGLKPYRNFNSELSKECMVFIARSYTDWKLSVLGERFSTGSLIYVNKQTPAPKLPDADAPDAEVLAYDKKNHWVAKVLEVRAASIHEVWLRVFWLYWPEELPGGRRKYHGTQEMVMSNHMDVVNAQAVAGAAEVNFWNESDEDEDVGDRFWRQFFNVGLQSMRSDGLSTIRKHCICNQYYNPDRTMLKCPSPKCGIWNHEECLQEAIERQSDGKFVNDQCTIMSEVAPFPSIMNAKLKPGVENDSSPNSDVLKFNGRISPAQGRTHSLNSSPLHREDLPNVEISLGEKGGGPARAIITYDRVQGPEIKTESLKCLRCGSPID